MEHLSRDTNCNWLERIRLIKMFFIIVNMFNVLYLNIMKKILSVYIIKISEMLLMLI